MCHLDIDIGTTEASLCMSICKISLDIHGKSYKKTIIIQLYKRKVLLSSQILAKVLL